MFEFEKEYNQKVLNYLHKATFDYYKLLLNEKVDKKLFNVLDIYVKRKGKFLRPFIIYSILNYYSFNINKYRNILGAVELMEAATISFDDVIDRSPLRRGGKSTYLLFGPKMSYLSFNISYNFAYKAFLNSDIPLWRKIDILENLTKDIFLYFWGQNLEIYWSLKKIIPDPKQYLAMSWDRVRFLSFNAPFFISGHLIGETKNKIKYYKMAGSYLGMGYHLHGDELNLLPRSDEWGKDICDDISANRYTYIIIELIKELKGKEKKHFLSLFGKPLKKKDIEYIQMLVKKSNALIKNRRMIDYFFNKYKIYLGKIFKDKELYNFFIDLGKFMCYERKK